MTYQSWRWDLTPILNITLPKGTQSLGGEVAATEDPDLEEPQELGPEVTCFLRGLAENLEEEEKTPSSEPPVKELWEWVKWEAEASKMPNWWRELMKVPEVEDHEKLAQEVKASF